MVGIIVLIAGVIMRSIFHKDLSSPHEATRIKGDKMANISYILMGIGGAIAIPGGALAYMHYKKVKELENVPSV